MRKFCLILCVGLLSSMWHAVAMPVETFQTSAIETVLAHDHHGCGEEPEASTAQPCGLSGHMCCFGITAATRPMMGLGVSGAALFNPVCQTLVLQDHPNPQFKPPKPFFPS